MRYINIVALSLLLIILVPSTARSDDRGFIEDMLDIRSEWAVTEGYEVFYTDISEITASPHISYFFELDPGYYIFVADGGHGILDLDMFIYDKNGYELAGDILDDNYPVCEVTLNSPEEIYVEVSVYTFAKGVDSDLIGFFFAGEVWDLDPDSTAGKLDSGITTDDIINYWETWAQDQGYQVLYTDSGVLDRERPDTWELDLERGNYEIAVESLRETDDIDLIIYNESGKELMRDTAPDNYPICSFELRTAQTVTAEVVPVSYAVGSNTEYVVILSAEGGGAMHGFPTLENFDRSATIDEEADADFIESLMNDYMAMLVDKNFQNIFDRTYMVYGHGGLRVLDLDLRVFDDSGFIVAEDTLINNSPLCEFSVQHSTQFDIEIDGYEMVTPWREGDYLIIIARK